MRSSMIRSDAGFLNVYFPDSWVSDAPFFIGGLLFGLGFIAGDA
jgi:hypothetical protein